MTTVRELHDRAMELSQLALVARTQGDQMGAIAYALEALQYEQRAAELVPNKPQSEPTRSILYRSAASLAYQANELETARRLIAQGLAGYPPPSVAYELSQLFDQVRFASDLQARQVTIEEEEIQITLRGDSIGVGTVPYPEFIRRINSIRSLIDKTTQRLMKRTFQRSGSVSRQYRPYIPFLGAPQQGSFIISIKLQKDVEVATPLFFTASDIVDQILQGIAFVSQDEELQLRELTESEPYYNHFLSMTQDMAPDGQRVSFVGFASGQRNVELNKHKSEILLPIKPEEGSDETEFVPIAAEGILDFASSKSPEQERMGLTTKEGQSYLIVVQEGLEDLVRSYFKQNIMVTGSLDRVRNLIYLSTISPSDE